MPNVQLETQSCSSPKKILVMEGSHYCNVSEREEAVQLVRGVEKKERPQLESTLSNEKKKKQEELNVPTCAYA